MFSFKPPSQDKTDIADRSIGSVYRVCATLLDDALRCSELSRFDSDLARTDQCRKSRSIALSCIDKSIEFDKWSVLLKCRDKQRSMANFRAKNPTAREPISCHNELQDLEQTRTEFFKTFVTPDIKAFGAVIGMIFIFRFNLIIFPLFFEI